MAEYGVELYNEAGKVTYSTAMSTWNYVGSFIVDKNTKVTKIFDVLSLFDFKSYYTTFLNTPLLTKESKVPAITFEGANKISTDGTNTVDVLIVVLAR